MEIVVFIDEEEFWLLCEFKKDIVGVIIKFNWIKISFVVFVMLVYNYWIKEDLFLW